MHENMKTILITVLCLLCGCCHLQPDSGICTSVAEPLHMRTFEGDQMVVFGTNTTTFIGDTPLVSIMTDHESKICRISLYDQRGLPLNDLWIKDGQLMGESLYLPDGKLRAEVRLASSRPNVRVYHKGQPYHGSFSRDYDTTEGAWSTERTTYSNGVQVTKQCIIHDPFADKTNVIDVIENQQTR